MKFGKYYFDSYSFERLVRKWKLAQGMITLLKVNFLNSYFLNDLWVKFIQIIKVEWMLHPIKFDFNKLFHLDRSKFLVLFFISQNIFTRDRKLQDSQMKYSVEFQECACTFHWYLKKVLNFSYFVHFICYF